MKKLCLASALLLGAFLQGAPAKELPVSTYDKLSNAGLNTAGDTRRPLTEKEISLLLNKQAQLCMIGDSVTWAQAGITGVPLNASVLKFLIPSPN